MQSYSKMADPIQEFITSHLGLHSAPTKVRILNVQNAHANLCFANTLSAQKNRGHEAVLCWILYDFMDMVTEAMLFGRKKPTSLNQVQAELHAVLLVDGEILDITPDENPAKQFRTIVIEPRISVSSLHQYGVKHECFLVQL